MEKYLVFSLDSDYGIFIAESSGEAKDLCAKRNGFVDEFDMRQKIGDADGKLKAVQLKPEPEN